MDLRYLRGTTSHALCLGGSNIVIRGYGDAYMEGDIYNNKRANMYVFTVGGT